MNRISIMTILGCVLVGCGGPGEDNSSGNENDNTGDAVAAFYADGPYTWFDANGQERYRLTITNGRVQQMEPVGAAKARRFESLLGGVRKDSGWGVLEFRVDDEHLCQLRFDSSKEDQDASFAGSGWLEGQEQSYLLSSDPAMDGLMIQQSSQSGYLAPGWSQ